MEKNQLSKNKFKAIFDKTFNYTALVSCEGTIIEVNKTALDFAGMTISSVRGIKIWEAKWWVDKKYNEIKLKDSLLKALSGDFIRYETEIQNPSGKKAVIDFSIKPVFSDDGKVDVLIAEGRDITEIKKYRDELNASRRQLEIFVKHTPAAVAMFDRKMNYIAASDRWYKDYGLDQTDITGRSHYEIFPEIAEKKDWIEIHKSCIEGNIRKKEKDFFLRKDKSVDWIRWEIHPWYDSFGSIGGIIMFTEIITAQVEAEAEIKKQRKNAEKYLELAGTIIAAFDKDGNIITINKKWCDITGYEYSETIGLNWIENFIPETYRESVGNVFKNIFNGNLQEFESAEGKILTKNGNTRIISWSNTAVYDESGNFEAILSSGEDITEKKIAEKKIFEQSQLLDQVMESVVSADIQGYISYWNKGSENLFGYSSWEVVGKPISILCTPDKKEFFQEKIIKELETKNAFLTESRLQKKSGEVFYACISVSQKKDKKGKIVGIICSSIDISERKQFEDEVLKLNENLEERVEERTKLLETANIAVNEGIDRAKLIKETAIAANLNKNPGNAFEQVLELVCNYSGFDIGHIYLRDDNDKDLLVPSSTWYSKDLKSYRNFVDLTMETKFKSYTGLPGIVMAEKKTVWVEDIFSEREFIRSKFLKEHRLVSAFAFPVLLNGETEAVFEFYSKRFKKKDPRLEETLMEAGAQLGYALERYKIDCELKESESKLRAIFDHSAQLMGLLDSKGKILKANNTLANITGVKVDDFVGRYIWEGEEWLEKNFSLELRSLIEKASQGQKINLETSITDKAGNKRNLDFSLIPVKNEDGKVNYILPEAIDITLRRQAEEQLRKLALAVEKTVNGVIISDKYGYIEWINEGFTRMTGYTLDECKGKKPGAFLQGEHTDKETVEKIRQALNKKTGIKTEILNYKKNKEKFWIEIDIQPVFDENGELINFISIENDITDRYLITAELKKAKEEAEKANDAKGEFLANMSHEIRTPMNAIIGMTRLLKQTPTDFRQKDFLNKIELSGKTLLKLIEDILDISKIEAGKLELEKIRFSPEKVLTDISALMELKAREKGLDFNLLIDPYLPFNIYGDPFRLSQILLNLTSNAIKFTHKGEVEIEAKLKSKNTQNSVIEFSVMDTGIGLTETELKNLFNPFTQADMSTTRKYGGTGLGLAISQELVKIMGGDGIKVESSKSRGSRFCFELVFEYDEEEKLSDKTCLSLKILILDSNKKFVLSTKKALESFLFETDGAVKEDEFFEIFNKAIEKNYFFDLLIVNPTDITKPEKLKSLKEIAGNSGRDLKIILLTDYESGEIDSDSIYNFSDNYVPKFCGRSFLLDTIFKTFDKIPFKVNKQNKNKLSDKSLKMLENKKVLIAEDNELNTEVAVLLLKSAGIITDTAGNGMEAFEKILSNNYDAVLMDIQMPVLDGYKAAQKIRNEIPDHRKNIPIIAMTAHAMEKDRKKALDHKIDYYVTKPVNPDILFDTLCSALSAEKAKSSFAHQNEYKDPEHDLKKIDVDRIRLIFGDNINDVKDVLKKFYDSYYLFKTEFMDFLDKNNLNDALEILHGLKGASGNLGMTDLFQSAKELELKLKEKNPLDNSAFLELFYMEFDETIDEIKNFASIKKEETAEQAFPDKDVYYKLLEIENLLKKRSPESIEKIEKFLSILPENLKDSAANIYETARNYKFIKSLGEVEMLKNKLNKL